MQCFKKSPSSQRDAFSLIIRYLIKWYIYSIDLAKIKINLILA